MFRTENGGYMGSANRRDFMKTVAGAAAAVGIGGMTMDGRRSFAKASDGSTEVAFRELGSTGCKVSEIGFGAMNTRDVELIKAAIDMGVNYVDTAWVYMKGRNEEIVAKAIKGQRDKLFLTTKAISKNADELRGQMEQSLQRLEVDNVDLMLFHVINSKDQVLNDDYMAVFEKAKKDGLCRFVGVSTHENQAEVLDAAVESKFWDAALVGYNYFSPKEVGQAIARARKAGIGIIGMKNLLNPSSWPWKPLGDIRKNPESKMNPSQALIKWVLEDKNVDVTIPGITSFEQLRDDVAVMGMPMDFGARDNSIKIGHAIDSHYCRGVAGCTDCDGQCPNGVSVREINRVLRYAESYDNIGLAWENYRQIPKEQRIEACGDCDECMVHCSHGLKLTENIKRAKELFA